MTLLNREYLAPVTVVSAPTRSTSLVRPSLGTSITSFVTLTVERIRRHCFCDAFASYLWSSLSWLSAARGCAICVDSDGLVEPVAPGQLENLMKGKIIRRTVLKCERSKCTRPSKRKKRSRNVSKKDISCPHRVELLVFQDHPGEVYAIETAPHSGHGREEPRYQPLTENLKQYIQEQALLNIGPKTIISNVLKLASESKYRRFSFDETRILTTNKVDNFIRRVRNSRMVHSDDAVALDLMAMDPKNNIVHYDRQADQIVLVLCSDFQAAMLDKFGDTVFLDTVHGQTNKGLYQLTMLVVSETGKGVPVAYCLSNFEKAEHWSLLVEKAFNKTKRKPKDSIFMSDDCVKIKKCIRDMKGKHLLCWFHMMQAIDRRLSSYGGATKRKRDQDIVKAARSAIKYKIRDLQRAPDFAMYKKKVQEFYQWLLNDERIHQAMGRRHTKLPFVEDYIEIEGMEGDEELLKSGVVKAFRPSCLMDVENDPSKRFDTELHPTLQTNHSAADLTYVKMGFDTLINFLAQRFAPDIPSGWDKIDPSHRRQPTDRKHKPLFK
ncbi:hypothetical protein M9434_007193 [Picochlorum sp. BPE23]|nr:hypothetical protein M9434_007193 [Picochlorum sp. BPE23]